MANDDDILRVPTVDADSGPKRGDISLEDDEDNSLTSGDGYQSGDGPDSEEVGIGVLNNLVENDRNQNVPPITTISTGIPFVKTNIPEVDPTTISSTTTAATTSTTDTTTTTTTTTAANATDAAAAAAVSTTEDVSPKTSSIPVVDARVKEDDPVTSK